MLRAPNHLSPHLCPVNALVQLLVHQPADDDIVSSHQVEPVRLLGGRLVVAGLADDALDRVREHEVRHLVAGDERAGQRAAVDGEDENFFWEEALAGVRVGGEGGEAYCLRMR